MAKYLSNNQNNNSEVFSELLKIMAEKENTVENPYGGNEDYESGAKLMEEAHPDKVNILDSYSDNGIFENNVEQNDIDMEIAFKMPRGKTCTQKNAQIDFGIASSELINELDILASEMSVYKEDKLSKIATTLKTKFQKQANPLLIPGIGVGVAALSVIGWWLSSYGNKSDLKNTGIDHNIEALTSSIDAYLDMIAQDMSEETLSQIVEFLTNTKTIMNNIQKTRDSYMLRFKTLATQLRTLTAIDPSKSSVTAEQTKKLSENSEAKVVIKNMMEQNAKYKEYIETIIPMLQTNYKFIEEYLKQTNDIGQIDIVDTVMSYLGKQSLPSMGKKIVANMVNAINSLKMDIKLREVETNATIKSETEKVQSDLSAEFSGASSKPIIDDGTIQA